MLQRKKSSLSIILGIVALIFCLIGLIILPRTTVQADTSHQNIQDLTGKKIYLAVNNQEVSLFDLNENGASRLGALLVRDGVELAVLNWEVPIPDDADLIVLLAPAQDYSGSRVATLWNYLNEGGNVLVVVDPFSGFVNNSTLVELMWRNFGIRFQKNILINMGQLENESSPVLISELALIERNADHALLNNVDVAQVMFDGVCPLETEAFVPTFAQPEPILSSSDEYYAESDLKTYNDTGTFEHNIGQDISLGQHTVLAVSSDPSANSRILVVCDSSFLLNNKGFRTSPSGSEKFLHPANVQLAMNIFYWLLDVNPPTLEFEAPAPTATPTITPSPTPSPTVTPAPTEG